MAEAQDDTEPKPEDAERAEETAVGRGGTFDDLKLAIRRNTGWIAAIGGLVGGFFHYFFVGCASLLGLLVVLVVPIVIAVLVAVLLGVPGYLVYHVEWLVAPGDYTSPWIVVVTIFWSGYFVTHGWPHLWPALVRVFSWIKPVLVWAGRVLENISDDDEDEPGPTETAAKIAASNTTDTTNEQTADEETADEEGADEEGPDEEEDGPEEEPTAEDDTAEKPAPPKRSTAKRKRKQPARKKSAS